MVGAGSTQGKYELSETSWLVYYMNGVIHFAGLDRTKK
jgi:hypothetical protein